jgi:hypothetical protein
LTQDNRIEEVKSQFDEMFSIDENENENIPLAERIARKASLVGALLDRKPDSLRIIGALVLYNQAQTMVGINDALALRLYNQATRLSRKV